MSGNRILALLRAIKDGPARAYKRCKAAAFRRILNWYGPLGDKVVALGKWEYAHTIFDGTLDLAQSIRAIEGDTPATLRDVSIAQGRLGYVAHARKQWDEAKAHFEIQQRLNRQIYTLVGETLEAQTAMMVVHLSLWSLASACDQLEDGLGSRLGNNLVCSFPLLTPSKLCTSGSGSSCKTLAESRTCCGV